MSDIVSNPIRVITVQVQTNNLGYWEAMQKIVASDGIPGLFSRGLVTKVISNGIQAMLFSVLWKHFSARWFKSSPKKAKQAAVEESKVVESAVATPSGRKSLRKRQTPTQFQPGGDPRVSDQPADPKLAF